MSLIPDIYGEVSSYLENQDLYSMSIVSSEVGSIANRYLRPEVNDNIAFLRAVERNDLATVRHLLTYPRVDPNAQNSTALILAILNNRLEILQELLNDPRIDLSNVAISDILGLKDKPHIARLIFEHSRFDVNRINAPYYYTNRRLGVGTLKELLTRPELDPEQVENVFLRASRYFDSDMLDFLMDDPRINKETYKEGFMKASEEYQQMSDIPGYRARAEEALGILREYQYYSPELEYL